MLQSETCSVMSLRRVQEVNLIIIHKRDDTHMTYMKIVQFARSPTSLVHLRPKFFQPLVLGRTILNGHPPPPLRHPLQMRTNQRKVNIIQGWLLYLLHVICSILQVRFRFQYPLINLVWLSFDFFSFNWSLTICFFISLYPCVYSCPKISRNVFHL